MLHGTNAPAAATEAATATSAADLTGVFAIGEEGGLDAASRLEGDAGTAAGADGFFETAGMFSIPSALQLVVHSLNLGYTHPTKQSRSPRQCSLPSPARHSFNAAAPTTRGAFQMVMA